jgi:SAM-dependent methyltransferase
VARELRPERVRGRSVFEIGSRGYGIRQLVELGQPTSYVGVDIQPGVGVDVICSVEEAPTRFGPESFDVVLSTEVLEHVRDWRVAVAAMKLMCRPDGLIVLTTRSRGYPFHGRVGDFWRYEVEDLRRIFADFRILALESDPRKPGVFLAAQKPLGCVPTDLSSVELYSMIWRRRTASVPDRKRWSVRFRIVRFRLGNIVRQATDIGRRIVGRGSP